MLVTIANLNLKVWLWRDQVSKAPSRLPEAEDSKV